MYTYTKTNDFNWKLYATILKHDLWLFNLSRTIVKSTGSLFVPILPQSLLASFPPVYSRLKGGYLGSWKRRTSSRGRRRSDSRQTLRFPLFQLAGSLVKAARRWAGFSILPSYCQDEKAIISSCYFNRVVSACHYYPSVITWLTWFRGRLFQFTIIWHALL